MARVGLDGPSCGLATVTAGETDRRRRRPATRFRLPARGGEAYRPDRRREPLHGWCMPGAPRLLRAGGLPAETAVVDVGDARRSHAWASPGEGQRRMVRGRKRCEAPRR